MDGEELPGTFLNGDGDGGQTNTISFNEVFQD